MLTVLRQQIVDEATTWIGTPFVHQGRLRGVGVDCAGLLIGVAHSLGLSDYDATGYGRAPHAGLADAAAEREMQRIEFDDVQPGDILKFRVEKHSQHFGIVSSMSAHGTPAVYFVHSFSKVGRVVETRLDQFWRDRVTGAYRFPGVI